MDTSSAASAARQVKCPSCGSTTLYAPTNPWRPFCSARCKGVDFGAWATEQFRAPAELPPDDAEFGAPKTQA